MADRYWVGGTGTWNTSSTTNWSATSGGAAGASVPTLADAVIINASSGSPVITLTGALNCASLTTTGATCTLQNTGSLSIYGGMTLSATTTWNATGDITLLPTVPSTVTTNNITIRSQLRIQAGSQSITLGSAYTSATTSSNAITLISGTFNTNNFNITTSSQGVIAATGISTKAINLGTSTVSITANTNAYGWDMTASTGTTVSAASATITQSMSGNSNTGFGGGGFTYGTVTLTNNSTSATYGIQGANTFTNLTLTGVSTTSTLGILIYADQTVTGTLTALPGNTGGRFRFLIYSSTIGTARTISAGTTVLTDVDFRDITKAGAAAWTGTRLGDAGGNTGITFATPKTVYWNNTTNSVAWNALANWAASLGGGTAPSNYPLPQDTVIFSNIGTTTGNTIDIPVASGISYQYGPAAITTSSLSNAITITAPIFNTCVFTNTSTITLGGSLFLSRSTQTLYLANGPIYPTGQITLNSPNNSTFQITTAWTSAAASITLTAGTFNLNGFNATLTAGTFTFTSGTISLGTNTLSVSNFVSSVANTRAIAFGTGNITCTGTGSSWNISNGSSLTYTGTPTVNISVALGGTITACTTAGAVTNAFNFNVTTGTTVTISSGSVVNNLDFTGFTGIWSPSTATCTFYGSLTLVSGMTFTTGSGLWTFAATSGTQVITSASKTLFSITQSGVGGTVQFAAGTTTLSTTATYTLTNGTLDVGTNTATLSTGLFASNNSNTRSIIFGTGNITTTGSGTAFTTATATGLTYTGTPTVNISNNSGTATTVTAGTTGGASTNAFNFNFTTGTYVLTLTNLSVVGNVNFTGFTGTWSPTTVAITFYGNLTLVAGMTFTGGTGVLTFSGTSGVQTITSAAKSFGTITINNTGTSVQLVGNATGGSITFTQGTLNINSVTTSFTTCTIATGPSSIINGTLNISNAVTHTSGTFTLGTSGVLTAAAAYTFTAGSIVLGSNTLTALTFSSSNSNIRAINFGTGQITLTGNAANIWNTTTATNFTYSGTPKIVSAYAGTGGSRQFNFGAITVPFTVGSGSGNQFSFGTAGTDIVNFSGSIVSLDFTGFTGTWQQGGNIMSVTSGNLTLVPGMTCTAGTGVISFTATSGTQVITSATKTINPITIDGVGGTVQLADNASINNATTLTNGTLNLNNQTLSTITFSSNNSNTRSILFGTGNITTTGSGTAWSTSTATGLTYTGTPTVNISNNSATATTVSAHTAGGTEANVLNFNFTTGTYTLTLFTSSNIKSLNFTGFTGTWSSTTGVFTFYGSLTFVSGMTFNTGTGIWTLAATSGTQTITSGGKTLYAITQNGVGGAVALGDAFISNNTYTLLNGTLTTNNNSFTVNKFQTLTGTRTLNLGSSLMTITGSGTGASAPWYSTQSATFTLNAGTSTVEFSDGTTSAKDIYVRDKTFSTLKLSGAGIATYTFVGSGAASTYTIGTLQSTKTVAYTLTLPASETMSVDTFTCSGSAGNIVTINSSSAGTAASISKTGGGVVSGIDYLSIQDSAATPSSTWYAGANSTDVSNNTGWIFTAPPGAANSNYFLLF